MRYIKFYRHLLPYWKKEALLLVLSGSGFLLGLVNPYLAKIVIDRAYVNRDVKLFLILVFAIGFVFMLNGMINAWVSYLNRYVRLRVNFDLNRKIFNKLPGLPYAFFQEASTGEHLYKLAYDIERLSQFISDILPQITIMIPKSLFIFAIVAYLDWRIASLTLVFMPVVYLGFYFFGLRLKKALRLWIDDAQRIFAMAQEIFSHIRLVKAFGQETTQARGYIRAIIKNIRLRLQGIKLEIAGSAVNSAIHKIVLGLAMVYGGYRVIKGELTLGTLSALTLYLGQLSAMYGLLVIFLQQAPLGILAGERLEALLQTKPCLDAGRHYQAARFPCGKIEWKNITFGYTQGKIILENLSFDIEGGSYIGLVGQSGCGKTTLVSLLLRLYRPFKGEVLIDGYNIDSLEPNSFHSQIGAVLQEPYLWNDSIENNIRYGKQDATFAEIQQAAQLARIDTFIQGLPGGYHTAIGENACKISEGQKQRLAIARALIKKPRILILDEALASVDAEAEGEILDRIRAFLKESTLIVISHRLSTIQKLDRVYFLSGPDKIDLGRHETLIQANARYRSYLADQLR